MSSQIFLIANLMVKNESKIIGRCLESLAEYVDGVCVTDTGSTDDTVELIRDFFKRREETRGVKPFRIFGDVWTNFGHNRSASFVNCVEFCTEHRFDLDRTYALLLDADMQLRVKNPDFRRLLTETGHSLIQASDSLEYMNTRLLRCSFPWKCTGVTHEYWDGAQTPLISSEHLYLQDVGDGGCKDDKFTRDAALLEDGLAREPGNVRYMFYLAQTLQTLGEIPRSVEMYRRRIKAGQWIEEVWYSMYQLAKIYAHQKKPERMEKWVRRAYQCHPGRSEALYAAAKYFREAGEHYRAWHYWRLGQAIKMPGDALFLEKKIYQQLFKYEKTVLNYWVRPGERRASLLDLINYCDEFCCADVYYNLLHYVDPVAPSGRRWKCDFPEVRGYFASSTSILPLENTGKFLINIRYVKYTIEPDGSYVVSAASMCSGKVHTRNYAAIVGPTLAVDSRPPVDNRFFFEMQVGHTEFRHENVGVLGVEDLRLFHGADGALRWIGTSMEYTRTGTIGQLTGRYDLQRKLLCDVQCAEHEGAPRVEKNWIPLGLAPSLLHGKGDLFVYGWSPFTVGRLPEVNEPSRTLEIVGAQKTRNFYENFRGSSNFVEHRGKLLCVVHVVQYSSPRKYYHQLVLVDSTTLEVVSSSCPFYFFDNAIEYVLGIYFGGQKEADGREFLNVIVSRNDRNPWVVQVDVEGVEQFPTTAGR